MTAAKNDEIRRIEDAIVSTWPAEGHVFDGAWIARFNRGFTDRANALSVHDPADGAGLCARLDAIEALYRARGLPPTVRVTPLTPPALITALDTRGYTAHDETIVLSGPLPRPAAGRRAVLSWDHASSDWMRHAARCSARIARHDAASAALFARLACPSLFIASTDDDGVVQAALHRDHLTVHDLAVAPAHRRRGIARALMEAAMTWGRDQSAARLWIAVETDNAPARAFYEAYGLAEAYRYTYRRLAA